MSVTHQGFFDISEHGWKWWFVASMNGVMIGSFIKFTVLTYFWLDDTLGELEEHDVEKQDIWVVQALFADRLLAVELTVAFICISMMIQAGIDYSDIRNATAICVVVQASLLIVCNLFPNGVGAIVNLVALMMIVTVAHSSDLGTRHDFLRHVLHRLDLEKRDDQRRKLFTKLTKCELEDKQKFDLAWHGYCNHAIMKGHPDAESNLGHSLDSLSGSATLLQSSAGGGAVTQPPGLARSLGELMHVAEENNEHMHFVVRSIVEEMHGVYKKGPLKKRERVEEKANGDYGGNFLRVVDIVRSSAVFHSLMDFNRAVIALQQPGGKVQVVRAKDRVTTPLSSGYRDVLLNITVEGCDMVMELQLHFKDILAIKEEAHRIYDFLRTLGWEKHEIRSAETLVSKEEMKGIMRSATVKVFGDLAAEGKAAKAPAGGFGAARGRWPVERALAETAGLGTVHDA